MVFDRNGNLKETISVTLRQFEKIFGTNESRREKLKDLIYFLRLLWNLGCKEVYIAGSYITQKKLPNDIDVCVDMTYINFEMLKKAKPEFLSDRGIEKIRKEHKIHFVLFFDFASYELLEFFRKDRDDNLRGLVKINLNDFQEYDKE